VALALDDSLLFVTNQDDSTVSVIDTKTLKSLAVIDVGDKPEGISTHPDGASVYVANWFDNNVSVIDAKTLKVIQTISTGEGSRAFGEFISP
jgi:YVTN family beta-propeller protein